MKNIVVIGLGQFGSQVAIALAQKGFGSLTRRATIWEQSYFQKYQPTVLGEAPTTGPCCSLLAPLYSVCE